ncbi:AEC family transporter [Chitinophaga sp.]|uniref:AEC family transporter n=1 Tax=Chitinophaga sp. TaxID=1869181 RepID=UPI0031E406BA
MDNFILIAVCMLAGMAMQRAKLLPADAHKGINTWLMYLALPAVSLKYIPTITWSLSMLFPLASTVIVWAGSHLFTALYSRRKRYGQRSRSTLELASGYSNTSFIGFPLIIAYFGEQYLSIAIICDQVLFILLSTAGIITAIKGDRKSGAQVEVKMILRKLFTFPPFIGCISALTLPHFFNLAPIEPLFGKLAATVAPLALFSIGMQLRFNGWEKQRGQLSMVLLYKLLIAPLLVLAAAIITGVWGDVAKISIFEASMPTFITASVVAEQFNLNFRLVNLIIGIGILLSLMSTFMWANILQYVYG